MKNKGCLLVRPPILMFLSPDQNWANFGGFGGLGVRGFKKLRFLLQKARPCVNTRRLSHFASKSVEGCDLQLGSGKNRESHRASHRKDMSPLTQGLNYLSACDYGMLKKTSKFIKLCKGDESPTENSKNQSGAKSSCAKFQSGLTRRAILNTC